MRTFFAKLSPATVAAAVLFSLAWIVLGQVSPGFTLFGNRIAPYNWVAQPVSGLGLGRTGGVMNLAFILTGALLAVGIAGVVAGPRTFSTIERVAIGATLLLSPLGTAICGLFTLEQFMPHFAGFLLAMGAPVIGFAALGWRLARDPAHVALGRLLMVGAPVTLVLLVVAVWSFDPAASGQGLGIAGLTQRLLITEVLGLFAVTGWSLRPVVAR